MPFPTYHYRPLTPHDHKPSLTLMALGATFFTLLAASYHEPKTPSDDEDFSWPALISSFLLFLGGFFWLVLDSWYHGRAWWTLLLYSGGFSGSGLATLLGFRGLVPTACGLWVWVGGVGWTVFRSDFMGEGDGDGFGVEEGVEAALVDYDVDASQKSGEM